MRIPANALLLDSTSRKLRKRSLTFPDLNPVRLVVLPGFVCTSDFALRTSDFNVCDLPNVKYLWLVSIVFIRVCFFPEE